ncbi:MAG: Aspartate/glutamate leucyltransferase [Pseudomonadales bacterium]|nr:Aspartate/glutamate leucyltransferase [Pseudomonadales bacterium]
MGNPVSLLANIRVFATYPHECSYLDGEVATTLFVDPATPIDTHIYSQLSSIGFRRSGPHLYRPHCGACNACIPARVPVDRFRPDRSQRRVLARNTDLEARTVASIDSELHFGLYSRYIRSRHSDGDMHPPDRAQYDSFLTREWGCTSYVEFRAADRLLAVAVLDRLDSGLSAIYTFYDPAEDRRSLGSYVILWQIAHARQLGLAAVYLGYWIRDCRKMSYKTRFRPVELLVNGQWVHVD